MKLGAIFTKLGITQIYGENHNILVVTILKFNECCVAEVAKSLNDKYCIKLAYNYLNNKNKILSKPHSGFFIKNNLNIFRKFVNFYVCYDEYIKYKNFTSLELNFLSFNKQVSISCKSKGKGFAGVIKRHGFSGFPGSHGTHEYFRHGGSIGCRAKPGRVFKGKKMPGRMGNKLITLKNINIIKIDLKNNILILKGSIPGPNNSIIRVVPS